MSEEDAYPIGTHIALTLVGLVLVNVAVTAFGSFTAKPPAPEPTFERLSGRSMLNISRTELENILSKSQASMGASSCTASTLDESDERPVEPGKKDDLLGNAEEMLQRASKISGKTPRSLDKPKPGKEKAVFPTVIEVFGKPARDTAKGVEGPTLGPSKEAESDLGMSFEQEIEIAEAVSAFEAAVERSRDAHRRALKAEKERQTKSRQLTPVPTKPVTASRPTSTRQPKELPSPPPVAKPKQKSHPEVPTGGERVKESKLPEPKPTTKPNVKATSGRKVGAPTVGAKPQSGKNKKPKSLSKSKAHQNALLLATMSDEALAAMEKDRSAPSQETEGETGGQHRTAPRDTTLGPNRTLREDRGVTGTTVTSNATTPKPEESEKRVKSKLENDEAVRESQRKLLDVMAKTGWRCACEGGFLPAGMFGGAESVLRMGIGECYHNKKAA